MRGKVLSYNDLEGSGLISGDDGGRYSFFRGNLSDGVRNVFAGSEVDFEGADGKATSVYVLNRYAAGSGDKNKIAAALLALFLGGLGIHKFYLGFSGAGIIMLICGTIGWLLILPGLLIWLISFIEFIVYLTKTDEQFYQDYVVDKRTWF